MGSICGWTGKGLGPDTSRQAIDSMLAECGRAAHVESESRYDDIGGLAICEGLYATSFLEQDGIRAALVGSPRWDDKELAGIASNLGSAASLIRAYRNFGTDLLSRLHGPFALTVQDGDQTLVAIDRLGIHRLSYAYQDGVFVFATSTGSVVRTRKSVAGWIHRPYLIISTSMTSPAREHTSVALKSSCQRNISNFVTAVSGKSSIGN